MATTFSKSIVFEITEHIGVIGERSSGKLKFEVNRVSWNEAAPRIDIRPWSEEHTEMKKGITLSDGEAKALRDVLTEYFKGGDE